MTCPPMLQLSNFLSISHLGLPLYSPDQQGSSALRYDWARNQVFLDKSGRMKSFKPDSGPNSACFRKNLVSFPLPYLRAVLPFGTKSENSVNPGYQGRSNPRQVGKTRFLIEVSL